MKRKERIGRNEEMIGQNDTKYKYKRKNNWVMEKTEKKKPKEKVVPKKTYGKIWEPVIS